MIRIAASLVPLLVLAEQGWALPAALSCAFDQRCQPNAACQADDLRLEIAFDAEGSQANVTSDQGVRPALYHAGVDLLSFIEVPANGQVLVTSVQTSDGTAAHSRHGSLAGTLYPSQYVGRCEFIQ